MGSTYLIYTEMKIDGEWHCIDGWLKYKTSKDTESKMHLATMYENGLRSSFGNTYEKLCEIGNMRLFSDLSPEIQEAHPDLKFYHVWLEEEPDEEARYVVVDGDVFDATVPNGFQYHGVYHKDNIRAFKDGDIGELWEEDDVDLKNLSKLELKCYEYFEWDSVYDWHYWFKYLAKLKDYTVGKYLSNDFFHMDVPDVRLVVICI